VAAKHSKAIPEHLTYSYDPRPGATLPPEPMPLRPGPGPVYPQFKRRVPERLFYMFPALMWLMLSLRHGSLTLPSAANPALDVGGLWGESKSQALTLFGPTGRRFLAPYAMMKCGPDKDMMEMALAQMESLGLSFPLVGKPDRGYQGWGVRLLKSPDDLADYVSRQPDHAAIMLQALIEMQGEAGVFYIRQPGALKGQIVSMAFVYPPHVIGDGQRSVAELVALDPILQANAGIYRNRQPDVWELVLSPGDFHLLTNTRSARLGAVYRDALSEVTPALDAVIDTIAQEIPDFHFGRFDIRFRSLAELKQGRGFRIVELNGAGAEMLHIWDGTGTLLNAWACLWRQYKTLFSIGAKMRRLGHRPVGLAGIVKLQRQQERLRQGYPPSS
jgi:hypothetical protein